MFEIHEAIAKAQEISSPRVVFYLQKSLLTNNQFHINFILFRKSFHLLKLSIRNIIYYKIQNKTLQNTLVSFLL